MSLVVQGINNEEALDVLAAEQGRSTEDIYLEWVGVASQQRPDPPAEPAPQTELGQYDPDEDPLADVLGAFQAGIPDLSQRHDQYLGQSYLDSHDAQR